MKTRLIEVALPLPVEQRFTYSLADGEPSPPRGARVVVGFGKRRIVGFVLGEAVRSPAGVRVRPVREILDREPVLSETEWRLAEWIARYYVAPPGLVLRLFHPPGATFSVREGDPAEAVGSAERLHVLPVGDLPAAAVEAALRTLARAPEQRHAWEAARALERAVERAAFCDLHGVSPATLRALAGRGLLRVEPRAVVREPYGGGAELPRSAAEGAPTGEQAAALAAIQGALEAPAGGRTLLLQGITGSGKTRVYVEAADLAVRAGGRAIMLVPEISLTALAVSRFRARFGDRVAVLHSALSQGERFDAWRRIRSGDAAVVVGARSALFAPVGRAALIVVDEEHETAYKQDETPRYLARDVAVYRAALEDGVVLLGSATPSLESRANAETGKYARIRLHRRVGGQPLPEVEIVDLAAGRLGGAASDVTSGVLVGPGLSARLAGALEETLAAGDQALLFLNRRGFAAFVQCTDCGWVAECPNCRISLTLHRGAPRLLCHYCAHFERVAEACPACAGRRLDHRGLGTQQVESAVQARFPGARVVRMDVDTTGRKGSHARIYRAMQAREIDVLIGTQMIAKGFDLPGVALVGVVSADTALHFPDFRATERTFQLLVQVAGRAGRGERPGRVVFQTYLPEHHAITAAAAHDYEGFYRREAESRRGLGYPPWTRLANVVVSGREAGRVADAATRVADRVRERLPKGLLVVGPAPCPIERLRGRTRHHILLKSESPALLDRALADLARREADLVGPAGRLEIDRDPLSLL
ncbi:MAG TPA: primosomal protein N' [Gemmatimonadota bacterium]|nr:primosomal protein N' [Gemmatimonadota bacterium]